MPTHTEPRFEHSALLTIDVQNDFTLAGAPLEIPGTLDIVPALARLVAAFRAHRRPIVHVLRLYLPDGSNADTCRRAMIEGGARVLAPGSEGAELVEVLRPEPALRLDHAALLAGRLQALGPGEAAMYKPRWGAFYRTPLEEHLRALGVDTVVVAGCNFPNCPRTTVYEASERDLRIVLAQDAVSGLYDRGRAELEGIGVRLLSVREIEVALSDTD